MRKLLLLLLLLAAVPASAQLTKQGNEISVPCSGSTCVLVTPNSPVNPNLLVNSGTNTFLIGIAPPTNSVRLYITNDTPNACANLSVSIASTGNSTLTSFNNNQQAWQSIQLISGSGTTGSTINQNLPASGTIAITSQPIVGVKIAVFVVLSAGCNTTNVDMQVVFGTFAPSIGTVQGPVAIGQPGTTANPFIMAMTDDSNGGNTVQERTAGPNSGFSGLMFGLSIGSVDQLASAAGLTRVRMPASIGDGPLGVGMFAQSSGGSVTNLAVQSQPPGGFSCVNGAQGTCPGLFISDSGFTGQLFVGNLTTGTTITNLTKMPGFSGNVSNSQVMSCHYDVITTLNSGAGTADFYIQDSGLGGPNWDDRIHFAQCVGGCVQAAGIAGTNTDEPVHAYTDATIAASTIVSGPLAAFTRFKAVFTGTLNLGVTLSLSCK